MSKDEFAIKMASFAREYAFRRHGVDISITRYTNHRRLIPNKGWAVCWMGEYYLNIDEGYVFKYKGGSSFESAEDAYNALSHVPKEEWDSLMEREESIYGSNC